MPAPSDILQFLHGQLFETPTLPLTKFTGRTIVITGANTGLGFECAKQVAHLEASVLVLGCRDLSKGNVAKCRILETCDERSIEIHVWEVDMSSYASVISFANRMRTQLARLDALVANAGISTNEYHVAEGLESTLTVNVTATFLLSLLALPQLNATANSTMQPTHLTVVGSNVHCFADHKELQNRPRGMLFQELSEKSQADMNARYFLSKLIVMLCTREFAARTMKSGNDGDKPRVIINCPSPGWCKTDLFHQDDGGFWGRTMLKLIGRKAELGARTLTSAIAGDVGTHGQYLSECRVKRASTFVRSEEGSLEQSKVWAELLNTLAPVSPEGVANVP